MRRMPAQLSTRALPARLLALAPALTLALARTLALALALISPLALAADQDPAQEQEEELSELRRNAVTMGAQGLVAPVKIEATLPEYTDEAKREGIQGDVYIEAVVTKDGSVAEPKLVRGLPDDELNARALAAIATWKFKPGTRDDEPVDVIALFTVTYRIH